MRGDMEKISCVSLGMEVEGGMEGVREGEHPSMSVS